MEVLRWMGEHPILSVIVILIAADLIHSVVKTLKG